MSKPTIAVVGASTDRNKYGNRAVRAYHSQGYEVFPVNPHADTVEGLKAYPSVLDVPAERLNRISVYVPPEVGMKLLDEFARKPADEVWFNPGSESEELLERARELGLPVVVACSIVAIGQSPYALDG
jgi:predicted CoA-binding protein